MVTAGEIVGLVICGLGLITFGWMGCKEYMKWCERKSDERCQKFKNYKHGK